LIENEAVLKKILKYPIRELLIDASKGLGVDVSTEARPRYEETREQVEKGHRGTSASQTSTW